MSRRPNITEAMREAGGRHASGGPGRGAPGSGHGAGGEDGGPARPYRHEGDHGAFRAGGARAAEGSGGRAGPHDGGHDGGGAQHAVRGLPQARDRVERGALEPGRGVRACGLSGVGATEFRSPHFSSPRSTIVPRTCVICAASAPSAGGRYAHLTQPDPGGHNDARGRSLGRSGAGTGHQRVNRLVEQAGCGAGPRERDQAGMGWAGVVDRAAAQGGPIRTWRRSAVPMSGAPGPRARDSPL